MTLASLFASKGARKEDVAAAAGVDPRLFDRIDAGLQPMQRRVAVPVAGSLGALVPEVLAECPAWTEDESEAGRRPVPVDPGLYGGTVDFAPLAALASPPVVPAPARPSGWAVYNRPLNDSVLVRFDRDSGLLLDAVTLTGILTGARSVLDLAAGGGKVFAVASAGNGAAYKVDRASRLVEARSAFSYAGARAVEYEPATGTLWVGDTAAERLRRVRQADMEPAASLTLTDSGVDYDPVDLVALGGRLYVLAVDGAGSFVWKVDPSTDSIVGQSEAIPNGSCLTTDGTFVWVVAGPTTLYRLTPATMAGAFVGFLGGPLENPTAAMAFSSRLWVSERTTVGDDPKWSAIAFSSFSVVASETYPASPVTGLGRMATDGVFAWAPHAGSLLAPDGLERLNPNDYGSVLSARPASPVDAARVPAAVLFA